MPDQIKIDLSAFDTPTSKSDIDLSAFDVKKKDGTIVSGPIPLPSPSVSPNFSQGEKMAKEGFTIPQSEIGRAVEKDKKVDGSTVAGLYNTLVGSISSLGGGFAYMSDVLGAPAGMPLNVRVANAESDRQKVADFIQKARSSASSKEFEQQQGNYDISNGVDFEDIKGLAFQTPRTLLDMGMGALTAGSSYFPQAINDSQKELEETGNADKLTPTQKVGYLFTQGAVQAALEKVGLDQVLGHTGMTKKVGQKIASEVVDEFVQKGVKATAKDIENAVLAKATKLITKIKNVGVSAGKSFLVEGSTEGIQQGASDAIKTITNKIAKNDIFNQEDINNNFWKNILNNSFAGGVTGGLISGAVGGFNNTNKAIRSQIASVQSPEDLAKLQTQIGEQVELGNITPQEAEAANIKAEDYAKIAAKIPAQVSQEDKYKIIGGIDQRNQLQTAMQTAMDEVSNLDESFKKQKEDQIALMQAKLNQVNDYIDGIVSGKEFEYKENEGEFYKVDSGGKEIPITKEDYDIAKAVQEENKRKESQSISDVSGNENTIENPDLQKELRREFPIESYEQDLNSDEEFVRENAKEFLNDPKKYYENLIKRGEDKLKDPNNQDMFEGEKENTQWFIDYGKDQLKKWNEINNKYKIEPKVEDKTNVKATKKVKPTEEQIQDDIKNKRFASFTYKSEADVPDVFKDKIVTRGENKKGLFSKKEPFVRVTVPQSVADYELSKGTEIPVENVNVTEVIKPIKTKGKVATIKTKKTIKKTASDIVADDVLTHLGIALKDEVKTKPAKKYTSKNVDTISEEGLTDTQKKVVTDVKKVVKSVSKLVEKTTGKLLEVNIHETPDSYQKAVTDAGGSKQDSSTKGFYLDSNGTIHLNMGKVTTDTMLHEGFHPVLDYMAKNRPDIINDLHSQLEKLTGGKEVIKSVNELYEGSDPTTIKKEAITDFIAKVADSSIKIDKTNFEKVKDFVINAVNKLGFDIGKNIDNITDLKNLAELISEKFNKGEEIYNGDFKQITKSDAQGDILGAGKVTDKNIDDSKVGDINPIQFSKDKFEEKELSKLPVKSLKDVLSEFDNKAVAINTDPTRVGKLTLPSGKEIFMYGGPNYSALKENVDNNIGFASTALGKPKQVRGAINSMHENGKGLVLVTTQKPESMLGNAYALENTLDAITMLPKKVLKSSEFKNEFFGKDIVAIKDSFGKQYDEFVKKYIKADFSSPEVLDNMIKDLLNDIGNNFKTRNTLVDNLLAGIVEKSKRAATKNEPGYVSVEPNKFISKALFDYQGLNQEKLFYNIGEKGIIDAYMNEGKWGFITNGFTSDANIDHLSIQDKGIIHPQFNAKFHGENPFILDGAYMIDKLWTPKVMTENAKGETYIDKKTGQPNPFTLKSSQLVSQSMYPKGKVSEPNIKPDVEIGVPQFAKENKNAKIKEFINIQREKGISDEDIKLGLEKVADQIGLNSKKINDLLSKVEKEPVSIEQSILSGPSAKALNRTAERLGLPKILPGNTLSEKEYKERGRLFIENGVDPEQVANEFKQNPDIISADMISIAAAHEVDLTKIADDARKKYGLNSKEFIDAQSEWQDWAENVLKPMGTAWSGAGKALQGLNDIDTGSFISMASAYQKRTKKAPTEKIANEIEKLTKEKEKADIKVEELQAKLTEVIDKATKDEEAAAKTAEGIKEKAKKIASVIRTAKLSKPDMFSAASPASLVWDGAVEVAAKTVEISGDIAQAIKDGIEYIKQSDWYKNLDSEKRKEAEKQFKDSIENNTNDRTQQRIENLKKKLADIKEQKGKEPTEAKKQAERIKTQEELNLEQQIKEAQLENLVESFVNKKDSKFTMNQVRGIWNYAKEGYLNKGKTYEQMLSGVSIDLGLTMAQVRAAITQPKQARVVSDEMYRAMNQRRGVVSRAEYYIKSAENNKAYKFLKAIPSFFFNLKTYGHGTVGAITHAGMNIFKPSRWKNYFPFFIKQFKYAYGDTAKYEQAMEDLKNDPDFTFWTQAGLAIDPKEKYDEQQGDYAAKVSKTKMGKFFIRLGVAGDRGFNALKVYRLDLAKAYYDNLSDSEKADPDTVVKLAKLVNHATGSSEVKLPAVFSTIFFAPKLEASRWQGLIGDPFKAIKTLATWNTASLAEKAAAKWVARNAGEKLATYMGLLAVNAGILAAIDSDDEINFTDPSKSDFLKFKIFGRPIDVTGGMTATLRFINAIVTSNQENKKSRYKKPEEKDFQTIGTQARYKLSPFASTIWDLKSTTDAMGKPLSFLPWNHVKPRRGEEGYTLPGYLVQQQLMIPVSELLHEMHSSMKAKGMDDAQIDDVLKGIAVGFVSGGTGAKVNQPVK